MDVQGSPKKYLPKEICQFLKNYRKLADKIVYTDYPIIYIGWTKKPDCFWDKITLQQLMIERHVMIERHIIRQKFQNFV